VVIQTLLPQAPALLAAAAQDFGRFAAAELAERREACFPPFARLALVRWCGPDEALVREAARRGADALRASAGAEAVVLGPAPAPLARLRGRCRYHAVVSASGPGPLHAVLSRAGAALRAELGGAVELTVNIDPLTMM